MLGFDSGVRETFAIMLLQVGVEGGSSGNRQFGQIDFLI